MKICRKLSFLYSGILKQTQLYVENKARLKIDLRLKKNRLSDKCWNISLNTPCLMCKEEILIIP